MTTPRPGTSLTERELDVLRAYVACDYDYAEASRLLEIHESSVRQHVANVRIRAGLRHGAKRPLERLLRRPRVVGLEPEPLPW